MFDNLFTPSAAIWGGLIGAMVALPILIHLINLMRHKTVQWAAMEFLLKSHRKNRNWVWLKQLFLLLSRIAVLLLALFMLAQIGCHEDRISRLLGGSTTHHYVLLDDSFSMSDRSNSGSAFDRARSTLSLIASRAKNRQNQLFSLLRYSMARPDETNGSTENQIATDESNVVSGPTTSQRFDLNGELVDNLFDQRIEDVKARVSVSTLSIGIKDSLETVASLIEERPNENSIVYIVSDFRQRDWENPADIESVMSEIHSSGAAIEMINCVKTARPNLALTELEPVGNVRVAGTPLMMKVTVKNCSESMAEKIQVKLGSLEFPTPTASSVPADMHSNFTEIPTVFIQNIAPGESETRSFPVFFNTTGKHVVVGSLPDDSVAIDNQRWTTTEFSSAAKVLLIDDADRFNAKFMALAINPASMTGIAPEFRTKAFLRDSTLEALLEYDVVFLMDVDALDESAIKNIESFATAGGGVVFFVGPKTNLSATNATLYRNGDGIFPLPLEKPIEIPEQMDDRVPDIALNPHPMFDPVLRAGNSLLDLVQVKQIVQPPIEWNVDNAVDVTVAATVRGMERWPLVVEKPFGKGRVMAITTTAGPIWNNWSTNATFPLVMLVMEDYMASGNYVDAPRVVGTSIEISVPSETYSPNYTFITPGGSEGSRLVSQNKMRISDQVSGQLVAILGKRLPSESTRETDEPGVYDAWFRHTDSSQEVFRYALNVDHSESEMQLINYQKLLADFVSSKPTLVAWDQFNPEPKQKPASSLSRLLLLLLIGILVTEQLLAYSTSYHQKG